MKKIYVRTAAFHLHPREWNDSIEVGVYDSIDDPVAEVTIDAAGTAELTWWTGGDTYRNRDESWWNTLRAEVAKAVAR